MNSEESNMIKHHPSFELIQSFVSGDLPASLAAGIAIHADMCPQCQKQIAQLTEQVAEANFEQNFLHKFVVDDGDLAGVEECLNELDDDLSDLLFDDMISDITENDDIAPTVEVTPTIIEMKGHQYTLPKTISRVDFGKTTQIGKLARARAQLDEGEIHTSLLHIDPGGSVPEHTHNGFELTVLLEGSFSDEKGEYVKGDFIMLDKRHQHHPMSENGCLCYTVANDSLHFTQGINKLLNPIGAFIY